MSNKFYAWNGFYYEWIRNPHRLAIFTSRFNVNGDSAVHEQHLKLGNHGFYFNKGESAPYKCYYTEFTDDAAFIGMGRSEIITIKAARNLDQPTKIIQTITVPVKDLMKYQNFNAETIGFPVKVFLNGFMIEADNNHSGWHFGGLGLRLKKATWVEQDSISFECEITIRPTNVRIEGEGHGNTNWDGQPWTEEMDCIYNVQIDFLIISADPKTTETSGDVTLKFRATNKKQAYLDKEIAFKYQSGAYKAAFMAISGFRMIVHDMANHKGRYVRKFGVFIENTGNDPKTGTLSGSAETIFSNKGKISFRWRMKSYLRVNLITIKNGTAKHIILNRILREKDLCLPEQYKRRRLILESPV